MWPAQSWRRGVDAVQTWGVGDASQEHDPPVLPPGLERRRGCVAMSGFGALVLVLAATAELLTGSWLTVTAWAAAMAGSGMLAAVAVVVARSISAEERDLIERSQRRILPALALPTEADRSPVQVALVPGWFVARRLGDRPELRRLVADDRGLTVPGWVIEGRPRSIGLQDSITVAWDDIRRWRVRTDSDGPDTHELWTARPWISGRSTKRWPTLRIRRRELRDEPALLHAVRSLGQLPVEVEPEPAGRPRANH